MATSGIPGDSEFLRRALPRADLAFWAAKGPEDDYQIVAWSSGAESLYGFSRDQAIGANYTTLFVDDAERDRGKAMHERILAGRSYSWVQGFRDVAADGTRKQILTNSFRFRGSDGEWLLGEFALDVSRLSVEVDQGENVVALAATRPVVGAISDLAFSLARAETEDGLTTIVAGILEFASLTVPDQPVALFDTAATAGSWPGRSRSQDQAAVRNRVQQFHHGDRDTSYGQRASDLLGQPLGPATTVFAAPLEDLMQSDLLGVLYLVWPEGIDIEAVLDEVTPVCSLVEALLGLGQELRNESERQILAAQQKERAAIVDLVFHRVGTKSFIVQNAFQSLVQVVESADLSGDVGDQLDGLRGSINALRSEISSLPQQIAAANEPVPIAVVDLAWSLCASLQRGFQLHVDVLGDRSVHAFIGPRTLQGALEMVLLNAAQALEEAYGGGSLFVQVETVQSTVVRIVVEDDGPGVASEMEQRLFEDGVSGRDGTGRGLYLAQSMLREGGGGIHYRGRAPAGGAAFVVEVPRHVEGL